MLSGSKRLISFARPFLVERSMIRWWIVSLGFWVAALGMLYLFNMFNIPLMLGTFLATELTILLRFLINDWWVFGNERPSWGRLWQFHVACAGGAAIWWSVANALPHFGVHYLLASVIGSGCSVFFSMGANFKWIWRDRQAPLPESEAPRGTGAVRTVGSAGVADPD